MKPCEVKVKLSKEAKEFCDRELTGKAIARRLNEYNSIFHETKQMKTNKKKYAKRIESIEELIGLVMSRRSVIIPAHETLNKPKPASFINQWDNDKLSDLIELGMYLYEPEAKHVVYARRFELGCRILGWLRKKFAK